MKHWFLVLLGATCVYTAPEPLSVFPCSNEALTLTPGKPVRFETPAFPSFNAKNGQRCQTDFKRTDEINGIVVVFTNGYVPQLSVPASTLILTHRKAEMNENSASDSISYDSMTTDLAFTNPAAPHFTVAVDALTADWMAFQAIAFAPTTSGCPLSGVSVAFTDNSYQFPVWSVFPNDKDVDAANCEWKFTVPTGFSLRVHTSVFDPVNGEQLLVTSGAGVEAITDTGFREFSGDTDFRLTLNRVAQKNATKQILAYVTAVTASTPTNDCNVETGDDFVTVISHYNPGNGYHNGDSCNQKLTPNRGVIVASVTKAHLDLRDTLTIANDHGSESMRLGTQFQLDKEGGEGKFYFAADGAIVQAGYEVKAQNLECTCAKDVMLDCENGIQTGMLGTTSTTYCPNMKCAITIKGNPACPDMWLYIKSLVTLRDTGTDVFSLSVDGEAQVLVNSSKQHRDFNFFSPTTHIVAQITAGPSGMKPYTTPMAELTIYPKKAPKIDLRVLDVNNIADSVKLYGYPMDAIITVTAPEGYTLDMFVATDHVSAPDLVNFELYRGNSLVNYQGTLADLVNSTDTVTPRLFSTNDRGITINVLQEVYIDALLFFRIRELHVGKCSSIFNVVQTKLLSAANEFHLTIKQTPCMVTLLSYYGGTPNTQLSGLKMRSDAADANVKVVQGTFTNKTYFSYNNATAASWGPVTLGGPVNSLMIMQPGEYWLKMQNTRNITVRVRDSPQFRSVLFSHTFFGVYEDSEQEMTVNQIVLPKNTSASLKCTFFDVPASGTVKLQSSNDTKTVSEVGQVFNFTEPVSLLYKNGGSADHGVVLELLTISRNSPSGGNGTNPGDGGGNGTPGSANSIQLSLLVMALIAFANA